MKLELFKPELYLTTKEGMMDARSAALQSQAMLNKYIESLPIVYSFSENSPWTKTQGPFTDKLQARLILIEPIEKKECDHNPKQFGNNFYCDKCNEKLKAKWEVDE